MSTVFKNLRKYNLWGGKSFQGGYAATSYLEKIKKFTGNLFGKEMDLLLLKKTVL